MSSATIHLSWFETAEPRGNAIGTAETLDWGDFASIVCDHRRVGPKDTTCFATTQFTPEPDSLYRVRRVARNAVARTAIVLDIEVNKNTGEVPPTPGTTAQRLSTAGIVYTSHSDTPQMPRYRVVAPLSEEIDPLLPVCEVFARQLQLDGVIDGSKVGPAAVFYLPTCANEGLLDLHLATAKRGPAVDASWITREAAKLLAERQVEQERIAAVAHAAAADRLATCMAAGFDPNDSLIEKIRSRLDLSHILTGHKYDKHGSKFRHPNSQSGSFGADIKTFGGIERVYSHNGTDPLHRSNLPSWCTVAAVDAFDTVAILDFGSDRKRALKELAEQFGITKAVERKKLAKLLFRMFRDHAPHESIEASAFAEGLHLGLSRDEVCQVARWVIAEATAREAA